MMNPNNNSDNVNIITHKSDNDSISSDAWIGGELSNVTFVCFLVGVLFLF